MSKFELFPPKCEVSSVDSVLSWFTLLSCSLDRSLSARSRNQRKSRENLFTDMESRKSIEDFFEEVDEDLLIYTGE